MCGLLFYQNDSNESLLLMEENLNKIKHRGPDSTNILYKNNIGIFGFNRLSIIDLSSNGNQPFEDKSSIILCNGEIYNYKYLKLKYNKYNYKSDSDCEVVSAIFEEGGIKKIIKEIDGEFAFVIYDKRNNEIIAARDPMGIRPLFIAIDEKGKICFGSEIKSLLHCTKITPFPPGHYYQNGKIKSYKKLYKTKKHNDSEKDVIIKIRKLLEKSVIEKMDADAPVGYLLSGGLDSSLVCAIAQKNSNEPIKTFAVGIEKDPIDVKWARKVANHIGSDHTEYLFSEQDIKDSLKDIIWLLETWDVTTIRASIGMYLLCRHIKENTNIKVLMTGEVSDELFGYKYTDFAPSELEFQKEAEKRIKELYFYDILRADRCIAGNSIEARVPFANTHFIEYVMGISPKLKMNHHNVGKHILRKAFEDSSLLPYDILYREKAAFSDAVGHRSVDFLKELADEKYSDSKFIERIKYYKKNKPLSKEALMYKDIFVELFGEENLNIIPSYWLPNKKWKNCNVSDPSARALPNYGKSGE